MRKIIAGIFVAFLIVACAGQGQEFDVTNPLTPKSVNICSRQDLANKLVGTLNAIAGRQNGPHSTIASIQLFYKNTAVGLISADGEIIDRGIGNSVNCYGELTFFDGSKQKGAVNLRLIDPDQKNIFTVVTESKTETLPLIASWHSIDQLKVKAIADQKVQAIRQKELDRKLDEDQRIMACSVYASDAAVIFSMKESGLSFDRVSSWAAAQAYGPNGQMYKGSKDGEKRLLHTVGASFFGNGLYGKTSGEFHDFSFKLCMDGKDF